MRSTDLPPYKSPEDLYVHGIFSSLKKQSENSMLDAFDEAMERPMPIKSAVIERYIIIHFTQYLGLM